VFSSAVSLSILVFLIMTTFFSEAGRIGALKIKFISYITTLVESAVAK